MKNVKIIFDKLSECYPDAHCELDHATPFELLVAVILSAQCTDKRVNLVTKELFKICNTPEGFVELGEEKLSGLIKSCGFYKNKSKNIIAASEMLIKYHNGIVPDSMEKLLELPGVGRKTANVILSNAFGIPAIAVDTHVFRVSNRIGLSEAENVEKTEQQLMDILPRENWTKAHHLLIFHGRQVCHARKPKCEKCKINEFCDFTKTTN